MSNGESVLGAAGGNSRTKLPAVAVLPFSCIRHGTVSQGFGTAIAFAVTSALMRIPGLHVISAASTLNLRSGHPGNVDTVTAQLAARYLISGHIAQSDQLITLNVKLEDKEKSLPLIVGPLHVHLSQLQDIHCSVIPRLVAGILPEMRLAEIERALAKPPSDVTAYEKLLQAIVALHKQTLAANNRAKRLLDEVLEADPDYADAHAWYARVLSIRVIQSWAVDRQAACDLALKHANLAVSIDPKNALALAMAGHLNSYLLKRPDIGLDLLRTALDACPNEPMAWLLYGTSLSYIDRAAEGRRHAEYALSLSPCDPFSYIFHGLIALCCYASSDYEAAVHHCQLSTMDNPNYSTTYKVLAASLVALGEVVEARKAGAELLRLEPNYAAVAGIMLPFKDKATSDLMLTRLRTAGALPPVRRL